MRSPCMGDGQVYRVSFEIELRTIAVALLALGILAGLAFPGLSASLEPFALPGLFFVVALSLVPFVRVPLSELLNFDRATFRIVLWQQVVIPTLVIAVGVLARFSNEVVILMLVTACSGSLFAAPALSQLLNLDRGLALRAMLMSTLVMPLSLLAFITMLNGSGQIDLNLTLYFQRTLIFLVCPFIIFLVHRSFAPHLSPQTEAKIDSFAYWGTLVALLVFGIGITCAFSEQIRVNPAQVMFYFAIVTGLSVTMFSLSAIVMHRFGITEALTTAILGGFRNVGLGFALVELMLGHQLEVYVGVSMLPTFIGPFILQQLIARTMPDRAPA